MMDVIVWNAKGIQNDITMAHLKFLVKKYKLLFIAILEPIVDFSKVAISGKKLNSLKSTLMKVLVVKFDYYADHIGKLNWSWRMIVFIIYLFVE